MSASSSYWMGFQRLVMSTDVKDAASWELGTCFNFVAALI